MKITDIAQPPNAPLIITFIGWLISLFPIEVLHKGGKTVSTVAIIIWAYGELTTGINLFRKVLGGAVLFWTILSLFKQLN